VEHISVYHSHPKWIVEKWLNELSGIQEVESACQANDLVPPLTIRANTLKTDRSSLQRLLEKRVIVHLPAAFSPYGAALDKKRTSSRRTPFKNGFFRGAG